MTAEEFSASEALEYGLVDMVFAAEEFWEKTVCFAEEIASKPKDALYSLKKLVNAASDLNIKYGCALEQRYFSTLASQ
jgi:enoyl-CoA hydratase/carnithine racemase